MSAAPLAGEVRGLAVEPELRAKRDAGRKLLVTYLTGGLPGWVDYLSAMIDAGADAVEVGVPFSDPVMDGPIIQAASLAALRAGATPPAVFDALAGIEFPVPLVAMTYYNLVARSGHERFTRLMTEAGVRGAILPDLPLEESQEWEADAAAAGVETILLAAPVTPDERLAEICAHSHGFVYGVNLMGVTGERTSLADSSAVLARRLKAVTDLPVLMGVGISGPAQAVEAAASSDGVIVGSALMRLALERVAARELGAAVAALRGALDG